MSRSISREVAANNRIISEFRVIHGENSSESSDARVSRNNQLQIATDMLGLLISIDRERLRSLEFISGAKQLH